MRPQVGVILDDTDTATVQVIKDGTPVIWIGDELDIFIRDGADDPTAVANRILAAVVEWHHLVILRDIAAYEAGAQ